MTVGENCTQDPKHARFSGRQSDRQLRWLAELAELLAMPTVSALPEQRVHLDHAARWLARHLETVGLQNAQVLPGLSGSAPSVYADWLHAPGPTLLCYGHYDVQPAGPVGEWASPPFRAIQRGQNLFARGASDDKGQLFIHLKAIESYLATDGRLPLNVKVWLEGEEEIGSPNLGAILDREADRLRADAVLISDTEMAGPSQPSIVYGLRGSLALDLEVRGPRVDLHSGRYGGAVHNPIQALCELIAGLHDASGRIAVPDVYRRVRGVAPAAREALRHHGPTDAQFARSLGLVRGWGESGYSLFERTAIRPALTVNGITGGYTGAGGKSVIPSRALAKLSLRLVPDQEPGEVAEHLWRHLAAVTPPTVRARLKVTSSSPAVVMSTRHPVFDAAVRAVQRTWGVPPVFTRSGGTIPLVEQLHRRFGVPIVLLGFGLASDNIHAPNEKLNLPQFFRGVQTVVRFMAEYAS